MSWAAVAGAAVGVVGSAIASDSARSAANQQAGATRDAIGEQQRQFDITRQDYAPWREAGQNALGQLQSDIGKQPTAQEVMSGPGYQFGLDQGLQAIARRAAASGGRTSGASLKAANNFAQGYAGQAYGAEYQRRQDRLNRLAALAGIGQTSTAQQAQLGQQNANAISGLMSSQGDAAAAARLAQGSIWGNSLNQAGAALGRKTYGGGSSWGTQGLDQFFYGNGTSGD